MSVDEILRQFANCGLAPTRQRMQIAKLLLRKPQHLSAEQIIDGLRKSGSSVSKATVYNSLALFRDHGLVREITVDPSRRFYDSTTHDHHHFYNVETGELTDIPLDGLHIDKLPTLPDGTVQDSVEVMVRVRGKG